MGNLAARARATGILSLCFVVLSTLSATGALAGAAPLPTKAPQAAALVIGTNSCVGIDACLGAVGPIGDNSCKGDQACENTSGSIGDNSCISGDFSVACLGASGNIGDGSCAGNDACDGSSGNIGDNSCSGPFFACFNSTGDIGDHSCNEEDACNGATGNIGNNSCNGLAVCRDATGNIGDCANNYGVPAACVQPDARIRRSGGPQFGNNIYNTTGAHQYVSLKIYDGDIRRVYITIQNDGLVADSFTICQCGFVGGGTPGFGFGYFSGRGRAHRIDGGLPGHWEYTTPTLDPGEKYVFRALVSVDKTFLPRGVVGARLILVTSTSNASKQDAVEIWVQRK